MNLRERPDFHFIQNTHSFRRNASIVVRLIRHVATFTDAGLRIAKSSRRQSMILWQWAINLCDIIPVIGTMQKFRRAP